MAESGNSRQLFFCFFGIFGCYFVYGLLQETITKAKYGPKGEKFNYTLSLVFIQCIINAAFAKLGMQLTKKDDKTPPTLYAWMSLTYMGAMLASNHSLQHVSYPTQVLGKSVKPIPVMVLGVVVAGKRYSLAKCVFVLLIVIGVSLFMYKDDRADDGGSDRFGLGEILLLTSLTLDGLTGAIQDKARSLHQTAAICMMFSINMWSILWLAIGLVATLEIFSFITFVQNYPFILVNMALFGTCSAAGQIFIFKTVTMFGPLMCSIFTTTRKFFTILCSVVWFGHPMSPMQWLGTVFVFSGLALDNVYGKSVTKPVKT